MRIKMAASFDPPRPLSAKFKSDFAYPTVKDRLPVILTKVVDTVYRLKTDASHLHGQGGVEDLRQIVAQLSQLKNHVQTDKPLLPLLDSLPDAPIWNGLIAEGKSADGSGVKPSWFTSTWLLVECYFYRRIISAISFSNHLKDLDPFREQKRTAFTESASATAALTAHVINSLSGPADIASDGWNKQDLIDTEQLFDQLLHVALWGNKCDLSISAGAANHQSVDALAQLHKLSAHILHDDTARVWSLLCALRRGSYEPCDEKKKRRIRVDIVLDNAGFELVTDLCLAEFLVCRGLADVVHFHVKAIPWFVSDVTRDDWNWTLNRLSAPTDPSSVSSFFPQHSLDDAAIPCAKFNDSESGDFKLESGESLMIGSVRVENSTKIDKSLSSTSCDTSESAGRSRDSCEDRAMSLDDPESIGCRFKSHVADGTWVVNVHDFWTLPCDFSTMEKINPDLHSDLAQSDLIIFKGDLNYRKLVGDLKWAETTPFAQALRGFCPAPLVTLRTLKCDLVVGLKQGRAELAAAEHSDWMLSGSYGVVQFCESRGSIP